MILYIIENPLSICYTHINKTKGNTAQSPAAAFAVLPKKGTPT